MIATLPLEIRNQIISHLVVAPCPIAFDPPDKLKAHGWQKTHHEKVQEILRFIEIIPETRQLFYQHNIFHITDTDLEAFLSYLPPNSSNDMVAMLPRTHIRRLEVSIQPMLQWEARQNGGAGPLPLLLQCPALQRLEIILHDRFESVCEFDVTFGRIADTCVALGEKVGEENFEVWGSC
ncbi:MAG: hypothetical protein Q9200_003733, partial [Gallowayella weberi]